MSSPRPGPPAAPEEPQGRRGTVLIVDGDAAVRRVLRLVLEGEGWRAVTAPDARRALAMVDDDPPDVVLIEVSLADLPGTEVAAAIAKRSPRPRVVLMSAYPRPFPGPEDAFLSKPLLIGRLVRLLESLEG